MCTYDRALTQIHTYWTETVGLLTRLERWGASRALQNVETRAHGRGTGATAGKMPALPRGIGF
ncbi:MAG TPA: hypothetical protein VKO18_07180, partial [Terriglobia bacterium]|nr:hypothetical protein [Terriglobia bacterium]